MSDAHDPLPRVLTSHEVFAGHVISLQQDHIELANGHVMTLDVVRHPGAAAIVALDEHQDITLVRQLRHPIGTTIYEIPAGRRDPGESAQACAARELREETGLRADSWQDLGPIWTTPGFCDECIHLFLAQSLQQGEQALDADELLQVETMPLRTALAHAGSGAICDAKTLCALLRVALLLHVAI